MNNRIFVRDLYYAFRAFCFNYQNGYVPHTSIPSRWLTRSKAFWMQFFKDKDDSIQLHMENMLDWTSDMIADLIDEINNPILDINLDLGNAHCDSRTHILDWICRLGKRIGYMHMHDNHGEELERLPLGKGNIPLRDVCGPLHTLRYEILLKKFHIF